MNARVHQPVHSADHAASYYAASVNRQLDFPPLAGEATADVCIIGGGFSGLNTAIELAERGLSVVLVEAHRVGDGASGRNGGQLGTGQRAWAEDLEAELGLTRARALFGLGEEAKAHLLEFSRLNGIDIDYVEGQLSVAHKQRYVAAYRAHAEIMAERFSYPFLHFMDGFRTSHELSKIAYAAFFEGTLRDDVAARCFLRKTFAKEQDEVQVSAR